MSLIAQRALSDGRSLYVYPLTFGRARLSIGNDDWLEDNW